MPSDIGTFFSIKQLNKPIKKVEVFHSAAGGASGGTIESIFSMGKLPKEMRDPFVLNPKTQFQTFKEKKVRILYQSNGSKRS